MIEPVIKWKTSDQLVFDKQEDAERRERLLPLIITIMTYINSDHVASLVANEVDKAFTWAPKAQPQ
jgi:hypothetical protein